VHRTLPRDATPAPPRRRGAALSVVIPAYNEERAIAGVLEQAHAVLATLDVDYEIVVVDDCSTDATAALARSAGARVLPNLQNSGYGYSLMRGIRSARHDTVATFDADGSYPVDMLPQLLAQYRLGMAMVVGHRQGKHYVSSARMRVLRWLFRYLTEFIVGRSVPDVNSGMRVFERRTVLPLFPHVSSGFSFTTSITLLFMMRARPVTYVPIPYLKRIGRSKVTYLRDSLRALQILASITARLNPIKLFLLAAIANVLIMSPVLALLAACGRGIGLPLVLVMQCSALLVALGFVVEALIEKVGVETEDPGDADVSP
jgi:glycosyltransferase involved in cell wall biosynthesis